jgi:hypothetical protein
VPGFSIPDLDQPVPRPPSVGAPHATTTTFVNEFRRCRERAEASSAPVARGGFFGYAKRIPEPKRGVLDFDRYPFQLGMYEALEDAPEAVVMKATQVGISALLIRWVLYWADVHGQTALYVFPKARHLDHFYDTRIKPLFSANPYLGKRSPPGFVKNKSLRQIADGFLHLRGSESRDDLQAIDADVLALDEYDDLNPANIPSAERRISGSPLGLIRRVGVPTEPEWGIAAKYEASDQRRWMVKCESCNTFQPIDFWKNVDTRDERTPVIVCWKCRKPLDVAQGEWVAAYPDREVIGFHVNRLLVPGTNLRQIVSASKARDPLGQETFFQKDLGLPHTTEDAGLDREAIEAAKSAGKVWNDGQDLLMVQGYRGPNLVTMGVDVASVRNLHVSISEHVDGLEVERHRKVLLWAGEIGTFREIIELLGRYSVSCCVIDHLPESRLAYGIADHLPGLVYVCHYADMTDPFRVETENRKVAVRRDSAHEAVVDVVRARRHLLPADLPADWGAHMRSPRRRVVKDDETNQHKVGWPVQGPDDYFQASVYDLVATEVLKHRLEVNRLTEPEFTTLDKLLYFERSRLDRWDDMEYRPGPGGDDTF